MKASLILLALAGSIYLGDTEKILQTANKNVTTGAAVNVKLLTENELYRKLVEKEYNSLTPENAMKMASLQPREGSFEFSNTTALEDLALNAGKKRIHGHTLIWYRSLPQWVKNWETQALPSGMTRAQKMDSVMSIHIRTVISHYDNPSSIYKDDLGKPLLKSWDVVNEAFDDNGNYRALPEASNQENGGSIWYRTIGKSYIKKAFTYARTTAEKNGDTGLKLFYNDYGHDYSVKKLDSIYKMAMALKQVKVNGKPIIDGIGMQFHININTSVENIKNALIKMKSTGLLIHISELDISLNKAGLPFPTEILAIQKQKYKDVALLYRKYVPANQRWGITLWNVGDQDSWLTYKGSDQVDAACLFDLNYQRKPAFFNFYDGLKLDIPAGY
ncbi:endo-1,4-beta-xylanase [Pedobacter cryoconitis]|uniref:Beta-xylanase n=1 Tax=Pedobacter cryoconitis TaxID=188932 RepID=A0A7W8ZQD3_9SPHI|nr:endo-1,4-beta-xylanase [Pedobacter cryoconitis]MBB5638279.1 endo-1,4-beta-xylanase [Pedobacter cryoconitis]